MRHQAVITRHATKGAPTMLSKWISGMVQLTSMQYLMRLLRLALNRSFEKR